MTLEDFYNNNRNFLSARESLLLSFPAELQLMKYLMELQFQIRGIPGRCIERWFLLRDAKRFRGTIFFMELQVTVDLTKYSTESNGSPAALITVKSSSVPQDSGKSFC